MAELALAAAEKILRKEIDASAHKTMLDSFAKEL
jgi:F0F1-type ATP synthase membrane subunit b/b'